MKYRKREIGLMAFLLFNVVLVDGHTIHELFKIDTLRSALNLQPKNVIETPTSSSENVEISPLSNDAQNRSLNVKVESTTHPDPIQSRKMPPQRPTTFRVSPAQQRHLSSKARPKATAPLEDQWNTGYWALSQQARVQFSHNKMPNTF